MGDDKNTRLLEGIFSMFDFTKTFLSPPNAKQSNYILSPSVEADQLALRATNPWHPSLPEVKDFRTRINGR